MVTQTDTTTTLILGIDPGTHIAGVVVARCTPHRFTPILWAAVDATSKTDTLTDLSCRIAEMRSQIDGWLHKENVAVDIVGCEWAFYNPKTTNAASEGLFMVIGGILCLPCLTGSAQYCIAPIAAKAVYCGTKLRREQAKLAAISYVRRVHHLPIGDDLYSEAIADACAVAEATWGKWREVRMAQAQTAMRITPKRGLKV